MAEMVGSIATASQEQSNGIAEITASIGSLDSVTQKNAAISEETNAATQELSNQVAALSDIAAFFTIDGGAPVTGHAVEPLRRAS
jgi:methyl-accepting chemotaxis protein